MCWARKALWCIPALVLPPCSGKGGPGSMASLGTGSGTSRMIWTEGISSPAELQLVWRRPSVPRLEACSLRLKKLHHGNLSNIPPPWKVETETNMLECRQCIISHGLPSQSISRQVAERASLEDLLYDSSGDNGVARANHLLPWWPLWPVWQRRADHVRSRLTASDLHRNGPCRGRVARRPRRSAWCSFQLPRRPRPSRI